MPAGKFYRSRRKRTRRPRNLTKQIKQVIFKIADKKHVDTDATSTPEAGVNSFINLTDVAGGTTDESRIGNSTQTLAVQLKGEIYGSVSAGTVCRMIIFRALNDLHGASPTITELLDTDAVHSLRNQDHMSAFKVYYDKRFSIQSSTTGNNVRIIDYYKRFKTPVVAEYDGAAAADATRGHIYLLLMCNQSGGAKATWVTHSRVTYTDV